MCRIFATISEIKLSELIDVRHLECAQGSEICAMHAVNDVLKVVDTFMVAVRSNLRLVSPQSGPQAEQIEIVKSTRLVEGFFDVIAMRLGRVLGDSAQFTDRDRFLLGTGKFAVRLALCSYALTAGQLGDAGSTLTEQPNSDHPLQWLLAKEYKGEDSSRLRGRVVDVRARSNEELHAWLPHTGIPLRGLHVLPNNEPLLEAQKVFCLLVLRIIRRCILLHDVEESSAVIASTKLIGGFENLQSQRRDSSSENPAFSRRQTKPIPGIELRVGLTWFAWVAGTFSIASLVLAILGIWTILRAR